MALVVAIGVVVFIGSGIAHATGDRLRDASVSDGAASAAEWEARLFWDNPFERLLFVDLSATAVRPGVRCPTTEVTAFSFFGLRVGRVAVDCEGVRRLE